MANNDEAVGGEIYSLLIEHQSLTTHDITRTLRQNSSCVQRCLEMLEKQSLVSRIPGKGDNHQWQLADGSDNSSGYHSDLREDDSLDKLSLKSIASSMDDPEENTSLTYVKQASSLCNRGQQNSEPLSQSTSDIWSCGSCTYHNEQKHSVCKICGTQKVRGSSMPDFREHTNVKSLQTSLRSLDMEETTPKVQNFQNDIPEQTRLKTIPVQKPMIHKEIGGFKLSTSSQIREIRTETVDPEIKPFLDNLNKIFKLFSDPTSKNLKPAEVAKKCGIGESKKAVNAYLYHLEKKGVLNRASEDGNKDPRWNCVPGMLSKVTDKQRLEWAAELAKKPKGKSQVSEKNLIPEAVEPEVHHHHHHHHHKNYIQVGNETEMHIGHVGQIQNALTDRERYAEGYSQTKVKEID